MLLAALSALVAGTCVAASARRLAWAVAPTPLDPELLSRAVATGTAASVAKLAAVLAGDPTLAWEEALFAAEAETKPGARDAALGEQITDFEWLAGRWSRAPRVCASVSTSAGFFLATLAVLQGMDAPADGGMASQTAVLTRALDALTIGVAGTAFCGAVHVRARRLVAARWASLNALVERLRASSTLESDAADAENPTKEERG